MGSLHISATLVPRGPAAAFILDDEQVATVGEGAKRFPVVATINGHPFRLSVRGWAVSSCSACGARCASGPA
jgi:hypothetical protein